MQVRRRCGAEVGRVLAVQQPVGACSSVTGSFGLDGRGKPAPVGRESGRERSRQARAGRDAEVSAGCRLRCCVAAVCELQRVEGGRSGWIEPGSGIQV